MSKGWGMISLYRKRIMIAKVKLLHSLGNFLDKFFWRQDNQHTPCTFTNMTLHLTRISSRYTLQVSDRLVSGGIQDPLANKNLIYWARDAIVMIAYTGLAYGLSSDPDTPTDEWIAETLRGHSIPRGPDGIEPVTFGIQNIPRWLDIGQSIQLLRDTLQQSMDRLPASHRDYPFELVMAGWQQTRRQRFKPISANIVKPRGNAPIVVERLPRYWHFLRRIRTIPTPNGYLTESEMSDLAKTLSTASPDAAEKAIVEKIRIVASRHPQSVGPHCMSILLPPPGVAPIGVRFIPSVTHTAVFQTKEITREIPVAFSPWVVGPNMFTAPSIMVGPSELQMGPHRIVLDAPAPEKGIRAYFGSLRRPKGP